RDGRREDRRARDARRAGRAGRAVRVDREAPEPAGAAGAVSVVHLEEDVLGKVYDARLARRILPYVRPHARLLMVSIVFLVLISGAQLVQPYLIKLVIDGPVARGTTDGLATLAILFALAAGAEFGFRFAQMYSMEVTGQRVILDLRLDVYRHLQRLPSSYFDRNPVGRLVTRLTSDVENLAEVFSSGIVTLLGDSMKLVGIVAILLWMDLKLAALTLLALPLLGVLAFFFRVKIRDAFRMVRSRVSRLNAFLQEQITGMAVVQPFQRQRANHPHSDPLTAAPPPAPPPPS